MDKLFKKSSNLYEMLQYIFVVAYIVWCIIKIRIHLVFYLGIPILNTILFFIYKKSITSKIKPFTIYRIGLSFYVLSIPHYLLLYLEEVFNIDLPEIIPVMLGVIFVFIIIYVFFMEVEKKETIIDGIIEKLSIGNFSSDSGKNASNYDVILCNNKETRKPVILEEDSRYLHMFVVGPTGCGKTSQVLIPMILQDVQKGHSIIVIEPKGDLAEKVYAMGMYYNNPVLYFNPVNPDCPYFNPLAGKEDEVIETLTTTFIMLSPDSATYFKDIADNLIRRSVMVLKRIEEAYRNPNTGISARPATLIDLSDILHNTEGRGRQFMNDLLSVPCLTASEEKQNKDTVDWFLNDYYSDRSKVYENSSGIRQQVSKLIQNKYLRKVLNPPNGINEVDFDKILAEGTSIAISTAQGMLRELGSYLGYFLIFSLQSAIFRRPGNEFTRKPTFLYIDEFQKYANPGMSDVLTQGRSYRVPAVLATQARELVAMGSGRDGKSFLEVVTANARNVIAFPGISQNDAKYFSLSFGDETKIEERWGESKQKLTLASSFNGRRGPTESIQYSEVTDSKFSEADIVYKPFSEITYKIIKNKSVQMAENGIASWIDKDINDRLDKIVSDYNNIQQEKLRQEEELELMQRQKMYETFQKSMNGGKMTFGDVSSQRVKQVNIGSEPVKPSIYASGAQNGNIENRSFVLPTNKTIIKKEQGDENIKVGNVIGTSTNNISHNSKYDSFYSENKPTDTFSTVSYELPSGGYNSKL